MKLLTVIVLVACLQASAEGYGQGITLHETDAPLDRVLIKIGKQSGYGVFFNNTLLKKAKRVSIEVENAPLIEVLGKVFEGQPLSWAIVEKMIVVRDRGEGSGNYEGLKKDVLGVLPIDIKGRVLNEKEQPVAGVTVTIKGSIVSTNTDDNGEFSLNSVEDDAVLVFTHVGMETFELKVSGKKELVVRLKTKVSALGEVEIVSTGYQDLPKERATGSFVKVGNELLNRRPSAQILEKITYVTNGLLYEPRNISIPSKSPISIRGTYTFEGGRTPLIIIDGFPYTGRLETVNINPNDVESITVLRDAAAASIWGTRAGNGVIVITTKKGIYNQSLNIQLNNFVRVESKPELSTIPIMTSSEVVDFQRTLFQKGVYNDYDDLYPAFGYFAALPEVVEVLLSVRKGEISSLDGDAILKKLTTQDIRRENEKYLLQKRIDQQYSLNISGGSNKMIYFYSVGYDKTRGNNKRNENSRFTIRMDNTYRLIKGIELTTFISYLQNQHNSAITSILIPSGATQVAPYTAFANLNGNHLAIPMGIRSAYVDTVSFPNLLDWHYRPLDELYNNNIEQKELDTRVGTNLTYNLNNGILIQVKYQYQKVKNERGTKFNRNSYFVRDLINKYKYRNNGVDTFPIPIGTIIDFQNTQSVGWNFRVQLNYNKRFSVHEISALLGVEASENESEVSSYRLYGYDEQKNTFVTTVNFEKAYKLRNPGIGSGSSKIPNPGFISGQVNRFRSYFLNLAYCYNELYTASLSARQDGANVFGVNPNNKVIPLWSAGFAWNLANENFYKLTWLPYLKFRLSYGFNGNIKPDATVHPVIEYGGGNINGGNFAYIRSSPNPSLKWEKIKIVNFGIDFQTDKKLISGSIEYYKKSGIDLISGISTDPTTGVSQFIGNTASIKGHGLDITINTVLGGGDLSWFSALIFSYTTNKVVLYKVTPNVNTLLSDGINGNTGKPLYGIYSYKWAGLDPINGDPRGFVADTIASYNLVLAGNNTKVDDLIFHGSAVPQIFGAFRGGVRWKNITTSWNFTYKFKYYFRSQSISYTNLIRNWGGHSDFSLRWQKAGDESITNVPSLITSPNINRDNFYSKSEVLIEKGDHIRLQDIRISYDFNKALSTKIGKSKLQLYLYFSNIGVIWRSNSRRIDPDFEMYGIPPSRSIALGVNATF